MSEDLDLEIEIDCGNAGIEELERGGKCTQPGWYLAVVEDVVKKKTESLEVVLSIESGPWKGGRVYETVNIPGMFNDPDKETQTLKKYGMVAQRLGLWDGVAGGLSRVRWGEAIGRRVVCEVVKRSYKDKETGEQKEIVGLSYAGLFPPDHEKIPDAVRQALKLPPARPAKPKDSKGQQLLTEQPPQQPPASSVRRAAALNMDDL